MVRRSRKRRRRVELVLLVALALCWTNVACGFSLLPCLRPSRTGNGLRLAALDNTDDTAIGTFLDVVDQSLAEQTFVNFDIRGPSKKQAPHRGCIKQMDGRLVTFKNKQKPPKLHVTFKYHSATDICKNWSITECRKLLTAILRYPPQPDAPLIPASEWGPASMSGLRSATLTTTHGVWELVLLSSQNSNKNSSAKLTQTKRSSSATTISSSPQPHDRRKKLLDTSHAMWTALGVVNAHTKQLKPGMSSKFKQCRKFVEIVQQLVESLDEPPRTVLDMGCGRGYLTFALHSVLSQTYPELSTIGMDLRPKLVQEISNIARLLGPDFRQLHFVTNSIQGYLSSSSQQQRPDVLIALHACDTATDDALWCGLCQQSPIIMVAPCCQKQVRPQLNAAVCGDTNHPYADVLRHNIYRERMTETVTDALRALLLEYAGYSVQVFEFVGGEHTSKNVMITAVHRGVDRKQQPKILQRIQHLAALHGIQRQALAQWMNVPLSAVAPSTMERNGQRVVSLNKMPPLPK